MELRKLELHSDYDAIQEYVRRARRAAAVFARTSGSDPDARPAPAGRPFGRMRKEFSCIA